MDEAQKTQADLIAVGLAEGLFNFGSVLFMVKEKKKKKKKNKKRKKKGFITEFFFFFFLFLS